MHFQQQQQLPPLIPIKKNRDPQSFPSQTQQKTKLQSTIPKNQDQKRIQELTPQKTTIKDVEKENVRNQKELKDVKIDIFSEKFKNIQEKTGPTKKSNKRSQEEKKEENQKSKFLIAEMLNKISAKNISQELYPITNQTIENVIFQMQQQIKAYKVQAQKKQNTLMTNQNNQHLKAQIANLQKSIDHCQTIKELYHQKINFRNKIAILQGKIIQLRSENRDLKIKVSRGIQKIQNHMHNLPCEKEKQLRQDLNKSTQELKKEKEMRQNLQSNIQDIIMNFKRLYEEADIARLIVTKKLKEIQDKQKKLNQAKLEFLADATDQQNSNSIKRSPKIQYFEEKKSPKPTNSNIHESDNSTQRYRGNQQRPQRQFRQRNEKETERVIEKKQAPKPMNLQESIKKMRGNQNMFSKIYTRT